MAFQVVITIRIIIIIIIRTMIVISIVKDDQNDDDDDDDDNLDHGGSFGIGDCAVGCFALL